MISLSFLNFWVDILRIGSCVSCETSKATIRRFSIWIPGLPSYTKLQFQSSFSNDKSIIRAVDIFQVHRVFFLHANMLQQTCQWPYVRDLHSSYNAICKRCIKVARFVDADVTSDSAHCYPTYFQVSVYWAVHAPNPAIIRRYWHYSSRKMVTLVWKYLKSKPELIFSNNIFSLKLGRTYWYDRYTECEYML